MRSSDRIAAADPIDDVPPASFEEREAQSAAQGGEEDEARRDTIPVPSVGPSPPRDTVPTPPPDTEAPSPGLSIPALPPLPKFGRFELE